MGPWIAPAVTLSAIAWLALLVAAPVLSTPLAGVLYAIGSVICHQISDRSFHLSGFQLPVCARCIGLYAGGALGGLAAVAARRPFSVPPTGSGRRGDAGGKRPLYLATAIAALPTVATLAIERAAGWPVSNVARAASALPLGLVVAFVVVRAAATLHYDECAPRRPIGHGQPPAST